MPKKLLLCIAVFTLLGCGSTPDDKNLPPVIQVEPSPEAQPVVLTPEEWLLKAQNSDEPYAVQLNLLNAARAFLDNDQAQQAGAVLVEIDRRYLRPEDIDHFQLQKARFFGAINDWNNVVDSLQDLEQRFTSRHERIQVLRLNYQAAAAQQQHFRAAEQLISLQPYLIDEPLTEQIWHHLSQVPADVWRHQPRSQAPNAQAWFHLLERLTTVLDEQRDILNTLHQWQTEFPGHDAQAIVDMLLEDPAIAKRPTEVAVLLPLSGTLEKQGNAIRYGILAALAEQGVENIHFIDTFQASDEALAAQLETIHPDLVIGPLERSLVERVAQFENRNWLQLALNHPPQDVLPAGSSYFALDIAAETQAAAMAMKQKNYQGILLFGPNNNRGRHLSDIFTRYWQQHQPSGHVRTGYYTTSNEMQKLVRDALKVSQSEQRQSHINALLPQTKIEMEFRTRGDIDAIYMLGDATQARLLKPYIDVSISTFGKRIPVYANSTVNAESQTQGESDLSGIRFADAPWLLPAHTQEALHQQFRSLINDWNRSEQRLTAMGYDSIRLAPYLALMQYLNGYSYNGLSGQLRIDGQILVRELSWAMFEGNHIALEPIQDVYTRDRN